MVNEYISMSSVMRNSFRYSLTPVIHSYTCFGQLMITTLIDSVHVNYQPQQGRLTAVVMSLQLVNLKVILEKDTPVGFTERSCLCSTSTESPGVRYRY